MAEEKEFTVCLYVYAEKYVKVRATSKEEAENKAAESEENSFSLCNHCGNNFELSNSAGAINQDATECEDD